MNEIHARLDMFLLIAGGSICTGLLVARLVLIAYEDLRQTWRKLKESESYFAKAEVGTVKPLPRLVRTSLRDSVCITEQHELDENGAASPRPERKEVDRDRSTSPSEKVPET